MSHYHLSPPPRKISLDIYLRLLFGGAGKQIGCMIFIFGLFFCLAFNLPGTISEFYHFSGELISTQGISTGYSRTNTSINDEYVYKTSYTFKGIDGRSYSGISYRTGEYIPTGVKMPVEFNPDNPQYSRIEGARYSVMGGFGFLILILPMAGFLTSLIASISGYKKIKILKKGLPAMGELISSHPTGTEINDIPVMKMDFQYTDSNGRTHKTFVKTTKTESLEDEDKERLLYDPDNPEKSLFMDSLSFEPEIDSNGNFTSGLSIRGIISLILPVIALFLFFKIFIF